jgi:hypothetical protein
VVHHLGGRTECQVLTSPAELRAALEGRFKIAVPDAPGLDAALGRLTVAQETSQ